MADNDSFKVMSKACEECLFGKNKIVSDKRKAEILAGCESRDSHFICHKGTIVGQDVCCHAFYKTHSTNLIRIARRLNCIEFVTEESLCENSN